MTADVFAEGLRKALRTDPDCIFLGEIREAGGVLVPLAANGTTVHTVFHTANKGGH
nr:ATPase, T2SS/T4P/T4SS family [Acidithiobacillus sulfurivorans]